ncbi:MAG: exonuclease domain-containing protein [Eubacteriales bacterium]|nr:exonuclease domain-containing protein [Eubacteriales bacterium]
MREEEYEQNEFEEDIPEEPLPRVDLGDFSHLIILDLEWNSPMNRYHKEQNGIRLRSDIIQIGAVKTDTDLQTVSEFNALIYPETYRKMNRNITEVTEITDEMLDGKPPFTETAPEFLDWCGDNSSLFTWSANDINELTENMIFYGFEDDVPRLPRCFDMQLMFDDQITMEGRDFSLSYRNLETRNQAKRNQP